MRQTSPDMPENLLSMKKLGFLLHDRLVQSQASFDIFGLAVRIILE